MFKNLKDWRPNFQIFQIIMQIIGLLKKPDSSQNYFPESNEHIYEMFRTDRRAYDEMVKKIN